MPKEIACFTPAQIRVELSNFASCSLGSGVTTSTTLLIGNAYLKNGARQSQNETSTPLHFHTRQKVTSPFNDRTVVSRVSSSTKSKTASKSFPLLPPSESQLLQSPSPLLLRKGTRPFYPGSSPGPPIFKQDRKSQRLRENHQFFKALSSV